jgi:hypothetical protein
MKITILLLFICVLISVMACISDQKQILDESDILAFVVSEKIVKQFKEKYDLHFIGIGQSGDKKTIRTLLLSFNLYHTLSKEQGRELITKCAEEFLYEVNNFHEIRPYLTQLPFRVENIKLQLFLYSDSRQEDTVDPNIWVISLYEGVINYKIADAQNPYVNKSWEKESYEDALRIVQGKELH